MVHLNLHHHHQLVRRVVPSPVYTSFLNKSVWIRVSSVLFISLFLRLCIVLLLYAPPLEQSPPVPEWTKTFKQQKTSGRAVREKVISHQSFHKVNTVPLRKAQRLAERRREQEDDDSDAILIYWDWWYWLENVVSTMWTGNLFCDLIDERVKQAQNTTVEAWTVVVPPKIFFKVDIVCADAYKQSGYGTGNFIQAIYMMRTVMRYIDTARVKLSIVCRDADELKRDFIFPWYTGTWYSANYFDSSGFHPQPPLLPKDLICGNFTTHPTALVYPEMQHDARRMAVALLGSALLNTHHMHAKKIQQFVKDYIYDDNITESATNAQLPSAYLTPGNAQGFLPWQTPIRPLIPYFVELDDAVIHFRCGDLLSIYLTNYGFMMFDGYSRHISPHVRTIGILTQPFCPKNANVVENQQRSLDSPNCERCEILVLALVEHLQSRFPRAKVSVRNNPSLETVALAYSRIVLANQSIAAMSTFSLFPMLGTFGTGYFLRPRGLDPSVWMSHPDFSIDAVTHDRSSIVLFDEKHILVAVKAKELWEGHGSKAVLDWFRTGRYPEGFYH
jgi:hypothetical protein